MRILTAVAVSTVLLACGTAVARSRPIEKPAATPAATAVDPSKIEFESFQVVFLLRGPKADTIATEELERIQQEHLNHLFTLVGEGKMVVAGPFGDQKDETFRGMCIYRVASLDEARALAEADPAVKAGRLRVEAMTWYTEKGRVAFPKASPAK